MLYEDEQDQHAMGTVLTTFEERVIRRLSNKEKQRAVHAPRPDMDATSDLADVMNGMAQHDNGPDTTTLPCLPSSQQLEQVVACIDAVQAGEQKHEEANAQGPATWDNGGLVAMGCDGDAPSVTSTTQAVVVKSLASGINGHKAFDATCVMSYCSLREVRVHAMLAACPEIVRMHQAYLQDEVLHLVLDKYDASLDALIGGGTASVNGAVAGLALGSKLGVLRAILAPVVTALAYAHERGIVHRVREMQ